MRWQLPSSFGSRLKTTFETHGQLCLGIDPHAALLEEWGLPDSVEGLSRFSETVLDASVGRVGILKPQVSFYERFGAKGFAALEKVCERASASGMLVIMDIKRGDIGSTMEAYFDAWLGKSAPFLCDAVTVSPFLGLESLGSFMANAHERGKGVIVLTATSNPEGAALQQAIDAKGRSVSASIWNRLTELNGVVGVPGQPGPFGAVVGATLKLKNFGLDSILDEQPAIPTPILAPGFGAQGARLQDIDRLFGGSAKTVIASVSRSVLSAGASGIEEAIDSAKRELAEGLA